MAQHSQNMEYLGKGPAIRGTQREQFEHHGWAAANASEVTPLHAAGAISKYEVTHK